MKWYSYLICVCLIVVGIFCSVGLYDLFDIQSAEYGTAITFETENDYDEVSKFDFGTISFDTEDYVTYTNVTTFSPQEFDGTKNDYVIFFNTNPLNNVVVTAGRISGDTSIVFYDLDGEEVTTANVYFKVEYSASLITVTVTMENENNSVSYLNTYMEINGAVLKVLTKGE